MILVSWERYVKVTIIITANIILTTLWVSMAIILDPICLIFLGINVITGAVSLIDVSDTIPDHYHMSKSHEYFIDDQGYTKYVHVKMFPGVWVKTTHQGPLDKFLEKKIDYQHKIKETFVI